MRTDLTTLASALRTLANDIESQDGVANAVCAEAAERIEELQEFVRESFCECYDEYGSKLRYTDKEGRRVDCPRCELLK